ncbi:MAG: hypothetical protein M3017_00305, partial [Actinomycetota bacterium]|nr:hypothetical protein [Actinomycetota bacterium]
VPGTPASAPVTLRAALLPESVRLFSALAGIGAAALTFGLCSNLVAAGVQSTAGGGVPQWLSPIEFAAAAPVAGWAVFLLLWAVQSLRRGTAAWPLVIARVLPVAAAVQLASLLYGLWQLPFSRRSFDLTSASALVLELAILGALGWLRRKDGAASASAEIAPPPAGRLLASMFVSAVLVSAVATAGLAATTAGHYAVPHGEHGTHQPALHDPAQHHP